MRHVNIWVTVIMAAACSGTSTPPTTPGTETDTETQAETDTEAETGAETVTEPDVRAEPEPETATEAGNSGGMARAFLDAHNQVRKQHCAPPLRWSDELAAAAQKWANTLRDNKCAFEHSRTRYGENLAAGTSGALDAASSTAMWYREVDQYDFARGDFSMATGHFTQVVWAGTTAVGCGVSTCNGLDIWVCNYDPPGNVQGGYKANVKPTGCR